MLCYYVIELDCFVGVTIRSDEKNHILRWTFSTKKSIHIINTLYI